ncbi:MCE family protein [Desulfobacter hydrogenophilus]|uniref:MCE family protein n=1 Tax=Desulfobacter hydrogenophilus TaxID=2291 RepID=A0A328FBS2_9BACT|nr:MlaD family protein [Desulfobacter hydrogenophilus]NDY73698.1 MCE family protein [Desulfobacter hydrogenophilus]QBH11786.1 MCE family protein [Desulfobacter hydrogenophilus]RAM00563.1 MCE family protein [Desulfobacter hydrogenophilus]
MTQKTNYFKLGLFVILAFALTAAMLIAFGAGKFFKTETLAETYFNESVQGLNIGSEVKYKGVKIGAVKSITTPTKVYDIASNYVLVTFSLSEDCYVGQTGKKPKERMKKAVDDGLSVFLSFNGLTGSAYLETDYKKNGPDDLQISWTPENLYVPSQSSNIKQVSDAISQAMETLGSMDFKEMKEDFSALLKSLNITKVSTLAESLLKELRQTNKDLAKILTSGQVKQILTDAGASLTDLKQIVHAAKVPIKQTLADINTASGSFKRMTTGLEQNYEGKLTEMADRMDTVLAGLEKTSRLLENMIWTNADVIEKTIGNLENTTENLNQFTRELRDFPGSLLMEAPPRASTSKKEK